MKRIARSLFIVFVVTFLSVGVTGAWFTAQDVEAGNSVATGSLVFDIRGHGGDFPDDGVPVDATGMYPGKIDTTYFEVYNHSNSIPMKYMLYTRKTGGSGSLYNKLKFRMYKCNYPIPYPNLCTTWVESGNGFVKDLSSSNYVTPVDNLVNTNGSHRWKLELWLDETAGNSYQGLSTTFDIVGVATQPENPGWSE